MNWLNLRVADLRAPEYLGSAPVARATWLNVLAYCFEQENGGVIRGAAAWGTRQWQQIAGVTADEVRAAAPLLTVHDDDIVAWRFPIDKQIEVQSKREQARDAARRRWSAKIHQPELETSPACGRIAPRNAEGEVGIRNSKSVVVESREANAHPPRSAQPPADRPPTDHLVSHSSAPASPGADGGKAACGEDEPQWIARLAVEWPRLDIRAEIRAANKKHPEGFDQPWFERKWLPHSKPRIASAPRVSSASPAKVPALPEPEEWKAEVEGTNYGPGGAYPAESWAELPPDLQKLIAGRIRERLCARP